MFKNLDETKEKNKMKFETSTEINKWVREHLEKGCVSHTMAGEHFQYEFLANAIVEIQTVKCLICKEEFTDYI